MAAGKKKAEEQHMDPPDIEGSLRDNAEEQRARYPDSPPDLQGQTPEELIHDLEVHQIELEMQAEELKRIQLTLEESRDKYLDLYESAPVSYLTFNDKALITGVNLTGATLLGANQNDIINHGLGRFIAPADLENWDRYFAKVRQHENKQVCTLTLLREDKLAFPARLEGVRTISNDGTIAFRIAISDLTDISEADKALQESEEKYRTLIDTLNEGIWVVDKNAVTTFVNPKMAMVLGYTVNDMIGRSLFSFMDEDGRRICEQNLERRQQGIKEQHDFEFLKKDGVRIYASLEATPIKGKNGEYLGAIAGVTDITERKRVEDALRKSEHFVSSILESTPNLIYIYDLNEHRNVFANKEIVEFLGYSGEQILSLGSALFENLLHPKDTQTVAQHHARMKTSVEGEVFECEYRMRHSNGTWRFLRSRDMAFLWDQTGEVTQILGSAEDITQRKQAEDELHKSELHYRELSDSITDVFFATDNELRYTHWNKASENLTGIRSGDAIGRSIHDLFSDTPEIRKAIEIYLDVLKNRQPRVFENKFMAGNRSIAYEISVYPSSGGISVFTRDITRRRHNEDVLMLSNQVFSIANRHQQVSPMLDDIVHVIREYTGCDSVGIRLRDTEGNIPYHAYTGFAESFYKSESPLNVQRDECMCIYVIRGDANPDLPVITPNGSFYCNGTTKFLAGVSDEDKGRTRNVCNEVGYESVALVAIKRGDDILGLIHIADHHEGKVPIETVNVLEDLSQALGAAIRRIQAEVQVRDSLAEKEVLLREVHHRVKNNLAGIISLIGLQAASLTDPVNISLLKDLETRIRSMALVHESLYRTKDLARVNVANYAENLTGQLFLVYGTGAGIRCRIEMGDSTMPIETAIPCGLVMNEIVTNSLKYAFPATFSCEEIRGEPCTITLTLQREGRDYLFTISDNGIGMPGGTAVSVTHSLGLYLIRLIVQHQLRGSLDISTTAGTTYIIRFPEPAVKEEYTGEKI